MFAKIIALVAFVAAVSGQADHYPAGIDPRLCPNYPDCADPAIAAKSIAASFGFPSAPGPFPTQYFGSGLPTAAAALPTAAHLGVPSAATHPAGVDPRVCPNYPYCDNELVAKFL